MILNIFHFLFSTILKSEIDKEIIEASVEKKKIKPIGLKNVGT